MARFHRRPTHATLQNTARSYCDRIIGMHAGRVVFDGEPAALTTERAIEVYGTETDSEELKQALGETSLPPMRYREVAAVI